MRSDRVFAAQRKRSRTKTRASQAGLQKNGQNNRIEYNHSIGVWLSLVERLVRDQEAGGSNPLTPTISGIYNGLEL